MRIKIFLFWLIFVISAVFSRSASSSLLEDQYFTLRDGYIKKFSSTTSNVDSEERAALVTLEGKIKEIVGPVRVKGFIGEGSINLQTLQSETLGFGQLDGISSYSNKENILVTTWKIFEHYANDRNLPKDLAAISESEDFYATAISSGAAVSLFNNVTAPLGNKEYVAYAHLGLYMQDTGPWLPDRIFILAKKGDRVIVVIDLVEGAPEIKECRSLWDQSIEKGISDAYEEYKACYQTKIPKTQFYKTVIEKAQNIIKHIYE